MELELIMSLELVDLSRIKVPPEVRAVLNAYADVHSQEQQEVVRAILIDWCRQRVDVVRIAHATLEREGLPGIVGDSKGKR